MRHDDFVSPQLVRQRWEANTPDWAESTKRQKAVLDVTKQRDSQCPLKGVCKPSGTK